jgi:Tfp pilus assembly protein PilV
MRRTSPTTRVNFARLAEDGGFVLVEVIVSALLVALISMLLLGVIAAGNTSGDLRRRSQADELAQQDQERMRGMSLEQLSSLNQTRTVTLDNVPFTITSTGKFLTNASGNASSCTTTGSSTADYVAIQSDVDWGSNNRTDVKEQSVIAPPAGGTLLTRVTDQSGNPLSGVRVTARPTDTGTSGTSAATTDSSGCTIFSALAVGDYDLTAARSGYVDKDGNSSLTASATATAGNTATTSFTLGQAGAITATFKTTISGTTYSSQQAPSLSYNNAQMATFGNSSPASPAASITTSQTLFPFFTTATNVFTNNYSAWAGKCASNQPPSNLATATVPPGGTGTASSAALGSVLLPPVILKAFYKKTVSGVTTTTLTAPDHIVMYNGCNSSFSTFEQWRPPIRGAGSAGSTDPTGALGALSLPGQPYGAYYAVCVDDQGYRAYGGTSGTPLTNTNFAGTTWNVTIDSTSSANLGLC